MPMSFVAIIAASETADLLVSLVFPEMYYLARCQVVVVKSYSIAFGHESDCIETLRGSSVVWLDEA